MKQITIKILLQTLVCLQHLKISNSLALSLCRLFLKILENIMPFWLAVDLHQNKIMYAIYRNTLRSSFTASYIYEHGLFVLALFSLQEHCKNQLWKLRNWGAASIQMLGEIKRIARWCNHLKRKIRRLEDWRVFVLNLQAFFISWRNAISISRWGRQHKVNVAELSVKLLQGWNKMMYFCLILFFGLIEKSDWSFSKNVNKFKKNELNLSHTKMWHHIKPPPNMPKI